MKARKRDENVTVELSDISQDESVSALHKFSQLTRDGTVLWSVRKSSVHDGFVAVEACLKTNPTELLDTSMRLALCNIKGKWTWRVDDDNRYEHKTAITLKDYLDLQQDVKNNFFGFCSNNKLIISYDAEIKKSLLEKQQETYRFRGENYLENIDSLKTKQNIAKTAMAPPDALLPLKPKSKTG